MITTRTGAQRYNNRMNKIFETYKKQEAAKAQAVKNINGYEIKYNEFWMMWQVSHPEIGACIAEFKREADAVTYCQNG